MVRLHAVNGEELYVNPDLIETVRRSPDTVLFLTTNKRLVVSETPEELVDAIVAYRRRMYAGHALANVVDTTGED